MFKSKCQPLLNPQPVVRERVLKVRENMRVKSQKYPALINRIIDVPMDYWGFAKGNEFLYTDAVANCLTLVIHNIKNNCGAIAHYNGLNAFHGRKAFIELETLIDTMIQSISYLPYSEGVDIFLWKGCSFKQGGKFIDSDFDEYFREKLYPKQILISKMDNYNKISLDSDALLYAPSNGTVYLLQQDTGSKIRAGLPDKGHLTHPNVFSIPDTLNRKDKILY